MALFKLLTITSPSGGGRSIYEHGLGVIPSLLLFIGQSGTFDTVATRSTQTIAAVADHRYGLGFGHAVWEASGAQLNGGGYDFGRVFGTRSDGNITSGSVAWVSSQYFAVDWPTDTTGDSYIVVVVGGQDTLAAVRQISFASSTTAAVSWPFVPTLLLVFYASGHQPSFGIVTNNGSTLSQFCVGWYTQYSVTTTNTARCNRTGDCGVRLNGTTIEQTITASGTGATTIFTASATGGSPWTIIALTGIQAQLITTTASTSSGAQTISVPFEPQAIMTATAWYSSPTSAVNRLYVSFGAWARDPNGSASQGTTSAASPHGTSASTAVTLGYPETNNVLRILTSMLGRSASVTSVTSSSVQLTWSTTGNAHYIGLLCIRSSAVSGAWHRQDRVPAATFWSTGRVISANTTYQYPLKNAAFDPSFIGIPTFWGSNDSYPTNQADYYTRANVMLAASTWAEGPGSVSCDIPYNIWPPSITASSNTHWRTLSPLSIVSNVWSDRSTGMLYLQTGSTVSDFYAFCGLALSSTRNGTPFRYRIVSTEQLNLTQYVQSPINAVIAYSIWNGGSQGHAHVFAYYDLISGQKGSVAAVADASGGLLVHNFYPQTNTFWSFQHGGTTYSASISVTNSNRGWMTYESSIQYTQPPNTVTMLIFFADIQPQIFPVSLTTSAPGTVVGSKPYAAALLFGIFALGSSNIALIGLNAIEGGAIEAYRIYGNTTQNSSFHHSYNATNYENNGLRTSLLCGPLSAGIGIHAHSINAPFYGFVVAIPSAFPIPAEIDSAWCSITARSTARLAFHGNIAGKSHVQASVTVRSASQAQVSSRTYINANLSGPQYIEASLKAGSDILVSQSVKQTRIANLTGQSAIDSAAGTTVMLPAELHGTANVSADNTRTRPVLMESAGSSLATADINILHNIPAMIYGSPYPAEAIVVVAHDYDVVLAGTTAPLINAQISGVVPLVTQGQAALQANHYLARSIDADIHGQSSLSAEARRVALVELSITSRSRLQIAVISSYKALGGLICIASKLDNAEPEAIAEFYDFSYEWSVGEIGSWKMRVPVHLAETFMQKRLVQFIRQGEGLIWIGIVEKRETVVENNSVYAEITGYGLARELTLTTTRLNWIIDNVPLGTAIGHLLGQPIQGWSASVEEPSGLVVAILEGATRFDAISQIATQRLHHVVASATERHLSLFKTPAPSVYSALLLPYGVPEREQFVLPVTSVKVSRSDEEIINRIIPIGTGEGASTLTLQWSDRTSPYQIRTIIGPGGRTLYVLEDDDSIAAYGVRERVVAFKNVAPIANSPAAYRDAANVLYDLAVAWLQQHKEEKLTWQFTVAGPTRLRDPESGNWYLAPGMLLPAKIRGVAETLDGRQTIVDLDKQVFVRSIKRTFDKEQENIELTVTEDYAVKRGEEVLSDVVEKIWALAVAQKHITFVQQFGPLRQSINTNYPVIMRVVFDNNVRFLHQVKIRWVCRPLRSNVATAAAGGGQTSSAGTPHSHSISATTTQSGGGGTSSAGSPHSHSVTVSGQTADHSGAHSHKIGNYFGTAPWADPPYRRDLYIRLLYSRGLDELLRVGATEVKQYQELEDNPATTHTHPVTAAGTTTSSEASHTHTIPAHSHNINAQTSSAESSHTHTINDHTHPLIYGIYETTLPSVKQVRLLINNTDVTNQLGGPWDQSEVELDITQFLQTMFLTPVQQSNTIELRANALFDIEVSVRAIITISSVVPLP